MVLNSPVVIDAGTNVQKPIVPGLFVALETKIANSPFYLQENPTRQIPSADERANVLG